MKHWFFIFFYKFSISPAMRIIVFGWYLFTTSDASEKYNAFYQARCSKLTQFFVTCTTGLFKSIIFTTIIAKYMRRQLITLCLSIKPYACIICGYSFVVKNEFVLKRCTNIKFIGFFMQKYNKHTRT